MQCPRCQAENPTGMRFCGQCAAPLASVCPSCGASNPPEHKFCGQCAAPLTVSSRPAAPSASERAAPDAERRQLTVMFCDLVGSTELAARFDPEVLRDVVRSYQQVCGEAIGRLHGHIAQYLGDGLLVYFGYPTAREDDSRRAVRAALGIIDAMVTLNVRLHRERGITLAVRVGIDTGPVVIGEIGGGGRREELALGETPNVAARLQALAEPDTVVISAATHRLLQGSFACIDLGMQAVKGLPTPLRAYRVQDAGAAANTLETDGAGTLTPMVGREQEVGLLLDRWEHVKDGRGHVVFLSGEPGIGKSRLVQVFETHIASEPHLRLKGRCSPYHQNSALHPVTEFLQGALRVGDGSGEEKLGRVEETLRESGLPVAEAVPFLAPLLGLPLPETRYPPQTLSAERHRKRTLETVLALLLELTARQPVLVILEDLHWVDPSTLEWLGLLVEQAPTARLFALLTARPDFLSPWGSRTDFTPLTLSRLRREQIEALVRTVAGGKALPPPVVEQVVSKTDGVPLFIEELTKMVLESGLLQEREERYELAGPLPPLAIPATLQDSLMARLDRLATVKAVAQLAATIGRSFPYALLGAVSALDDAALRRELAKLVDAELLYQRGLPPQATYTFKHALIQDAAYHALLKSTRQQYHQRIVQALEAKFPEMVRTQPELLAHHSTEAGLGAQAIPYWQRAGQRALERSANLEAISHLARGIELTSRLQDSPERAHQELALQLLIGPALMHAKGMAAPEVGETYARARELSRQVEDSSQRSAVLWGLWNFYLVKADLRTARELSEELLTLAMRVQGEALLLGAHRAVGITHFYLGELASARMHLEQGIVLYDRQQHGGYAVNEDDPGVACRSFLSCSLWLLGQVEEALQRLRETVALARVVGHPPTLVYALYYAARVYHLRRDSSASQELMHELIALSREHGFAQRLATGAIQEGWTKVERGAAPEGIAQMSQSLAAYRAIGGELGRPFFLGMLAEAYGKTGQMEAGLAALSEAMSVARDHGERWWEAELSRLRGELLLTAGGEFAALGEVDDCFCRAIDIARRQHAKSLELRAAMSLSRLWYRQGKKDEARRLLAGIYGGFTEGFNTPDLQDARTLLDALS